ncbi:DUF2577 family protein [Tissierella creatinophila]|nr:DUF2577 family protein [Tissierella creatinophila]
MFKERDNKGKTGPCIGLVMNVTPLKISILNGEVTLQGEHLYMADNLILKQGDEVFIIPTESEQTFFITNKAKKVGG